MSRWYVFSKNAVVGPYTEQQIHTFLANGMISVRDRICRETEQIWKTVPEFPEFNTDSGSNGVPNAAGQRLVGDDVKLNCPHCGQHYSVSISVFSGQMITCRSCSKQFSLILDSAISAQAAGQNFDAPQVQPIAQAEENIQDPYPSMSGIDFSEDIPEGNIVCPHCWKNFAKESVCYISTHPDLIGDPIAGEFEQRRFLPTVYHSNGLPLDARGMPCTDMACPHCHLRIPGSIVDLDSFYFSIAGAPSSGKSYFLTSMVHDLRKSMQLRDYSFYDVDPVINRVLNGYEDTIFMALDQNNVVSLPKTQQIGNDFSNQIVKDGISFELPKPFIFRIQSLIPGSSNVDHNLVFYDNAGEHFQPGAETIANPATIHLAHSDGIIFLFDPLNDANMRKECDQRDPQAEIRAKVSDQTTLFAEMVNRIRRHCNLTSAKTSDIPLIIAIGKYDAWRNMLPKNIESLKVFRENKDDFSSEIDMNVILDVSFALREMMLETAPALVTQAEAFFNKVYFVPISSFGCLASKSENGNIGIIPSQLKPIWVSMPINLLLAESGFIGRTYAADPNIVPDLSLVCKILNNQIIFRHPITGQRVALPSLYSGAMLNIGDKYYKMPEVKSAAARTARKMDKESIWR